MHHLFYHLIMDEFPLRKDNELDDMESYQESSRFRLILSFFVALFAASAGYPIGKGWKIYEYIYKTDAYYIDVLFIWLMIYLAMEYIHFISGILDKATPWKKGWKLRMSLQALVTILGPMFFMEYYSMFYHQMTGRSLLRIPNNLFQIPFSITLAATYPLYVCIRSLHALNMKERGNENEVEENESQSKNPVIAIRDGKSIFLLDMQIALIVYNDGINKIYPLDPEDEVLEDNRSLRFLHNFLDQRQYKKAGRDYIINKEVVNGYRAQADGNILLDLNYPYDERLYVSKGLAKDFIQWLGE